MTAFPSLKITEADVTQFLLLLVVFLLWKVLTWLQLIANQFGCNQHRAARIKEPSKKLDRYYSDKELGNRLKLSEEEKQTLDAKLDELYDMDYSYGPATGGQLRAIMERLDKLIGILQVGSK